ncbi:hypothetical protein NPIL_557981, partial [Nephila pilipes]
MKVKWVMYQHRCHPRHLNGIQSSEVDYPPFAEDFTFDSKNRNE